MLADLGRIECRGHRQKRELHLSSYELMLAWIIVATMVVVSGLSSEYSLKVELIGLDDGLDVACRRRGGVKDGFKVLVGPNSNDGLIIY